MTTIASQGSLRKSVNANAEQVLVAGNTGNAVQASTVLCRTPCPKLVPGESGSAPVTDETVSMLLCKGNFQINELNNPLPTEVVASLNLRKTSDGSYFTNIGFWYLVYAGWGSLAVLQRERFKWPYIPYNNIPSAPFEEVGDGTGLDVSIDLWINSGAGEVGIANSYVEGEAGNFYTPGTTQIGNSKPTGPIGSL